MNRIASDVGAHRFLHRTGAARRAGGWRALILWGSQGMLLPACGVPVPSLDGDGVLRVGDDFLASRGTLTVSENVAGDVMLAGGEIVFTGTADGDYLGAAGQQAIRGRVGGSVRAAAGDIELASEVVRNATLAGGRVHVANNGVIGGNAYVAAGAVSIDGAVNGSLRASGGEVTLEGSVERDVQIEAGRLRIGPAAVIGGDLEYRVPEEDIFIDPGARIVGATTALPPRPSRPGPGIFHIVLLLGFLVAGAAFVLFFPGFSQRAAAALPERPAASIGWGLALLVLVPVAASALAITLIGAPLALITFLLYGVALFLARVVPALWLGLMILRERARPGRGGAAMAFVLGGFLLILVELVPVLGFMVLIVATVLGLGAFAVALRARSTGAAGAELG